MQHFWIPALKARSVVGREAGGEFGAALAICKRAHVGLVSSRARLFVSEQGQIQNAAIPAGFWWAEGNEALEQDWERGDFSTWIDHTSHLRAFGVDFDFAGLQAMIAPERSFELARSLSVAGDPNWVPAAVALRFMYQELGKNPVTAGRALLDQCKIGFVPARAVLMQRSISGVKDAWATEEREWDVPEWFWANFTSSSSSSQGWDRGIFKGRGRDPHGTCLIQLTGVHFLREALQALTPEANDRTTEANQNKGGRPRKDWWDDMWCSLWGQIVHGELTPTNQADIERAMLQWVSDRGDSVAESTVKPMAKKVWLEWNREARN